MTWNASSLSAIRSDGAHARYVFGGLYPYAVSREVRQKNRPRKHQWLAGKAKSVRTFKTLASAMRAADKEWPL